VQSGSEKELVFRAKHFADCTGDATVGVLAGADYRIGREARAEFDEYLAPIEADGITMGSTITMSARDIGREVPYNPPEWVTIYRTLEDIGVARQLYHIKKSTYGGYWWLEVCNPYDTIEDNQEIRDVLLSHVLGVWNYIKNYSEDAERAKTYVLDWIGMVPGKRESRRLMGDVILTEHDVHEDRQWPDRVSFAGWYIDLHIGGGILNKTEPGERGDVDVHYRSWRRVPAFTLPLRAFYSRNVENLWMAGRNISVTHVALGSTRVQQTHGNQGQAVGTAAAYALSNNLTPRQTADPNDEHVRRIQQQLLHDGVHVLGCCNDDPEDLALTGHAAATSDAPLDFGDPETDKLRALKTARAQVFPVSTNRVNEVAFYLVNETPDVAEIPVELQEMERIWDLKPGNVVARTTLRIPAHGEGWFEANLDATVVPHKSYRICLEATPGVSWAHASVQPTGTSAQYFHAAPGGPEPQNLSMACFQEHEIILPAHEHWIPDKWFSHAIRVSPQPHPYGAENINNGLAWTIDKPNLWVSDPSQPLPQSVELAFGEQVTFNTVIVSFDTNLNLQVSQLPEFWKAATCAKHWRLYACIDGQWRQMYEEKDNYLRRREVAFAPVNATALKLEVLATNASGSMQHVQEGQEDELKTVTRKLTDDSARVYEIRVYNRAD
jgi:hypothetical protein